MQSLAGLVLLLSLVDAACGRRGPLILVPPGSEKTGRYIVVLQDSLSSQQVQGVVARAARLADGAKMRHWWEVDYIEEEDSVSGAQVRDLVWHLDRIDQRGAAPDLFYRPSGDGRGVDVYVLDSGVSYRHWEFGHRAKYAGYDPVDEYEGLEGQGRRRGLDCHGHGTHVASLVAGKSFGAAKRASIYSVRVLMCDNTAPWSTVLDGLDYVAEIIPKRRRPAVVSLSLAGSFHHSANASVERLVAMGIPVVVAASNGNADSCGKSPASSPSVITVAGSREGDGIYVGTSFGACVTIFAPGQRVLGADHSCNNCSKYLSGTSMATPLVSGVVAIHLQRQPTLSPNEIKQILIDDSTEEAIDLSEVAPLYFNITPNRLLYLPGSCGGQSYIRSSDTIHSPNFPESYWNHLSCEWVLTAAEGQQVLFELTYLDLEEFYDTLRICDGDTCGAENVLMEVTGAVGNTYLNFSSTGNSITVVLETDGTITATGFTGSFTKFYSGTDIKVPEPEDIDLPTVSSSLLPANSKLFVFVGGKQVDSLLNHMQTQGYKALWLCSYKAKHSLRTYFDVLFHNSSQVDTLLAHDMVKETLEMKIAEYAKQGYSVWRLGQRTRNSGSTPPYFTAIFNKKPNVIVTEVYLRESMEAHLARLEEKAHSGHEMIAQSVIYAGGQLEVSAVFTYDQRLAHNITVPEGLPWKSFMNLTFYQFTSVALELGNQEFYPMYVDTYNVEQPNALFSAIFRKRDAETYFHWYYWGLNTTAARSTVLNEEQRGIWDPKLSIGYTYFSSVYHFVEWGKKLRY